MLLRHVEALEFVHKHSLGRPDRHSSCQLNSGLKVGVDPECPSKHGRSLLGPKGPGPSRDPEAPVRRNPLLECAGSGLGGHLVELVTDVSRPVAEVIGPSIAHVVEEPGTLHRARIDEKRESGDVLGETVASLAQFLFVPEPEPVRGQEQRSHVGIKATPGQKAVPRLLRNQRIAGFEPGQDGRESPGAVDREKEMKLGCKDSPCETPALRRLPDDSLDGNAPLLVEVTVSGSVERHQLEYDQGELAGRVVDRLREPIVAQVRSVLVPCGDRPERVCECLDLGQERGRDLRRAGSEPAIEQPCECAQVDARGPMPLE